MALVEPEYVPEDFMVYQDQQTDDLLFWASITGALVAVVVVVVAYALPALGEGGLSAQAAFIGTDGVYRTSGTTYAAGAIRQLSTIVPQGSTPLSIEAFRLNPDGTVTASGTNAWNLALTGDDYIFTANTPTNPEPLATGDYQAYTVVTFAGGTAVQSNTCSFHQD
ncbi:MAG: hypothetical protein OK454_08420 [Thaumarchaeota archaeon]|nr:hypothetical protein [Nitrososphaerota archaeon]